MYGCESWTIKKPEHWRIDSFELWCWWRLLRVPLDCKVNPRGNQFWILIGRTDAEAPMLWPSKAKNWLIGKDPEAKKDWKPEEKGNRGGDGWIASPMLEFEQALGFGVRQWSLMCCSQRSLRESEMTEPLNWTDCNRENALTTVPHMSQTRTEKDISLTWKDKQGQQEPCACVCDGASGGNGWADSMTEQLNRKCFCL